MKNKNKNLLFYFLFTLLSIFIFVILAPQVFASTEVGEDITTDTVWSLAESPYIVRDVITVDTGATLTIEPGVIIKFDPIYTGVFNRLYIKGKLIAEGTTENRIYFTSLYDDAMGGDTNGDGGATTPVSKSWYAINFVNGSISNSLKYVTVKYGYEGIYFGSGSSGNIENVEVSDGYGGISTSGATVTINNALLKNLSQGLEVRNSGTMTASGVVIDDIYYHAMVRVIGGTMTISDFELKNGAFDGFWIGSGGTLNASDGKINNFPDNGIDCWNYFGGPDSHVNASNITIDGGSLGVWVEKGCDLTISNSSIKNSVDYAVYNGATSNIIQTKAQNNYWGDASGPYHETLNPEGLGDDVTDNVDFTPWLTTEPGLPPEEIGRDPLIIIPGITGSYLNKNYGDSGEIWPNANTLVTSLTDNFLDDLALNTDGTERAELPMRVGDIIRKVNVEILGKDVFTSHVFDNMISDLETAGYVEGVDLFVFPYDWRYSTAVGAGQLAEKIDEALDISGAEKVDIISHSMGGMVAKKYIADKGKDKIDQLVFLGTPHLGSPKALKALMWGDDLGFRYYKVPLLSPSKIKEISQNFPAMFELLPSREYVDDKWSKYVMDATGKYTELNLNYTDTQDIMVKDGRNESLFASAESIHTDTDNIDLSGVSIYNFTGCSIATPSKFTITRHNPKKVLGITVAKGYDITYADGDQTVPILSSRDELGGEQYFVKGTSHGSLPNDANARAMILSILGGGVLGEYANIVPQEQCGINGTKIGVHSPVALHITDNSGNHTGPTDTGDIEYNILDTQYDTINDQKFAFLPYGTDYHISLDSETSNTGETFDLYVEKIVNGVKMSESYFNEVLINSIDTKYTFDINDNSTDYILKSDKDESVSPSSVLDQNKSVDIVASETKTEIIDDKLVLMTTDDNSGVLKTEYSLDGENWTKYTNPINNPHTSTLLRVKYYSTDNAGNIEEVKEVTLPKKVAVKTNTNSTSKSQTPPNLPLSREEENTNPTPPPYRSSTPFGSFVSPDGSQNTSKGLAELQVFAPHPLSREEENLIPNNNMLTASAENSTSKTPSAKVLFGVFVGAGVLGFVFKRFIKL